MLPQVTDRGDLGGVNLNDFVITCAGIGGQGTPACATPFPAVAFSWEKTVAHWRTLPSDPGARYDKVVEIDASKLAPFVTWGTNPGMVVAVSGRVPELTDLKTEADRHAAERMLEYMGLKPGTRVEEIPVDRVFIGSCTNSRLEDLRAAARVAKGHHVSPKVRAMVVPGSQAVKHAAEKEGLDRIFQEAGFEWRESGCSMCLGMNPDILQPGERCASTSNRNFEGRQGRGGRTHLVSPMMAAAAAIAGHFTDIRNWKFAVAEVAPASRRLSGGRPALRKSGERMQPFRTHKGKVAPLDRANIDTDQIIPKQFLKRIERTGFGEFLFFDWRRTKDGSQDPSFSLNQPRYKGASILVTGKNFGCGSSREHAVWALEDFGFRAVIAPSFADIFANNCVKNGVLTVVLTEEEVEEIIRRASEPTELPPRHRPGKMQGP